MWNPENVCDYCKECSHFLRGYQMCCGELEPCLEYEPNKNSKYTKVEVEIVINDKLSELWRSD